jgi:hypothetical protein
LVDEVSCYCHNLVYRHGPVNLVSEQSETVKIKLIFYRNSRNARKLAGLVEQFTAYALPEDLQCPCSITINADSTADDLGRFVHFWPVVKKYKETALYTNGSLRTREKAESVIDWIRCYCNRSYFENQSDYCCISPGVKSLHGFGCKWLCSVLRHGRYGRHAGVHWYNVGPFLNKVQYIDKQQIKDMIAAEAELKALQLCPCFSLERAFQYVDMLPDQIDPQEDYEWVYIESGEVTSPHEIVGVEPKAVDVFSL